MEENFRGCSNAGSSREQDCNYIRINSLLKLLSLKPLTPFWAVSCLFTWSLCGRPKRVTGLGSVILAVVGTRLALNS
jgi:hypothetical protein